MSTRYSLRQTPRKKELYEGMIETPIRRSTRRKSQFPVDLDADSSATESDINLKEMEKAPGTARRRRGIAKFVKHIDESAESDYTPDSTQTAPTMASPPSEKLANNVAASNLTVNSKSSEGEMQEDRVIDGWKPGMDHRVDLSGHYEFGGPVGVAAIMIGFTLLTWYMWIGATYYDGKLPLPAPGQSWEEFGNHLWHLGYTGGFPSAKAWLMYWSFAIFEAALYCLAPGVWGKGKPLPHEGGKQLDYYCSAQWSWYITILTAAAIHFSGLMPLYTIIDEFGPLLSVAILSGWIVSILAYVSALARGAEHRMSGNVIYDFFMGAELNPRMFGILDFKMFFEVRLPWYILFLLSCGTAARQWDRYGYVSGEVLFLIMAHFLYANACSKGEELIITSWDMYYEKWGFMLIFWNMAGVPLSYCHCTIYLANHDPSEYHWSTPALAALFVSYLFVYWVWDSCNSQKNRFRAQEKGHLIQRKSFPQLPWQTIENPRKIETSTGDAILADGWYGLARKTHYTCDAFFAASWGLITGFRSPFPWFYPVFFCCMISHRAWRDVQRCREKYGDAWTEYEKMVPYLFIPYVF